MNTRAGWVFLLLMRFRRKFSSSLYSFHGKSTFLTSSPVPFLPEISGHPVNNISKDWFWRTETGQGHEVFSMDGNAPASCLQSPAHKPCRKPRTRWRNGFPLRCLTIFREIFDGNFFGVPDVDHFPHRPVPAASGGRQGFHGVAKRRRRRNSGTAGRWP